METQLSLVCQAFGVPRYAAHATQCRPPSTASVRRTGRHVACSAGAGGDDWQGFQGAERRGGGSQPRPPGFTPQPASSNSSSAAGRQAAYSQLLDPLLNILSCDQANEPATHMLRALLRAEDPAAVARLRLGELDERLFETIRNCWGMGMRVFRTTPRQQDASYYAAMVMLDGAWTAAAEAHAAAVEPELSLLKRLMNAWSFEERARLLSPPEAARALVSQGGLFFSLLDREWQRCAEQDAWGDAFLEGQKALRLAKLASIRSEARQRVAAAAGTGVAGQEA